jgi:hypothetical protein
VVVVYSPETETLTKGNEMKIDKDSMKAGIVAGIVGIFSTTILIIIVTIILNACERGI